MYIPTSVLPDTLTVQRPVLGGDGEVLGAPFTIRGRVETVRRVQARRDTEQDLTRYTVLCRPAPALQVDDQVTMPDGRIVRVWTVDLARNPDGTPFAQEIEAR